MPVAASAHDLALRQRGGFSLVELVIVLAIVGIISAMAVPRYLNSLSRYRAEAAAGRIAADLDLARASARQSSSSRTVQFDTATGWVRINELLVPQGAGTTPYVTRLGDAPYHASIVSVSFEGETEAVFDGFGQPLHGGEVVVQAGSVQRTVVLEAHSGRTRTP